jgi:putative FmdB family regulatory protein
MPLYDYECECGCKLIDHIAHMNETTVKCPDCGKQMKRLFHANYGINMGVVGAYGYYDDTLDKYISTEKQRREEMRKQGVTEKGETPKLGSAWV